MPALLTHAAPYIPESNDEILERLPQRPGAALELRQLRSQLAESPKNLDVALTLARRYIVQARAESDPRYLGYAEAALKPWWDLIEPPVNVLVLRATLKQSVHNFDGALDDLALALKRDPRNVQAWLTRATVLQVQGKYAEALANCDRLRTVAPQWIDIACAANVASLSGRAKQSYDSLLSLTSVPGSHKSWVETSLAEITERLGEDSKAEAHYEAAVKAGDAYAKGAYADFLLDRKRYAEVAALLNGETRADALLLRLALAEHTLGDTNAKQRVDALSARFAASRMRGDRVLLREEARFTLHLLQRPKEALALAQENWQVQREPADARILLEAALAAGDSKAAAPVLQWLKETGLEDVRIAPLVARLRGQVQGRATDHSIPLDGGGLGRG